MLNTDSIGWWNTGMPLVVLAGLAFVLPRLLVGKKTLSQGRVAFGIIVSANLILVIGAVIFAGVSAQSGAEVMAAWQAEPKLTAIVFLRKSAYAALVWVPVLALVWFALAQAVEARKGAVLAKVPR